MKILSISKDSLRSIRYDMRGAYESGVNQHPQTQMRELGIHLLAAVPETIADCWICLTNYQGELPSYICELELKPHDVYWRNMFYIDIVE